MGIKPRRAQPKNMDLNKRMETKNEQNHSGQIKFLKTKKNKGTEKIYKPGLAEDEALEAGSW